MRVSDKQINEMIATTMKLAQSAASLELTTVSCLYRMVLLELTNLTAEQAASDQSLPGMARERIDSPLS